MFRPCAPYIYACHRLSINFVYVSHLFSRGKGVSRFFLGNFCHTFSEIFRPCAMYIRQPPSFFFCFWLFWLWFFTKDDHYNFAIVEAAAAAAEGNWGYSFIPYTFVNMCCLSCSLFLSSSVHFTHISFSQILIFGPHLLAFKPFTNLKNASNSLPNTP